MLKLLFIINSFHRHWHPMPSKEEVRAYWTKQWSEIDPHVEPVIFHPEGGGRILVEVHQVVRDLAGTILADECVGHRFTFEHGLIQSMEVCSLP